MIAKKKPGDKSCVMFGCVNEETSKQSPRCKQCAKINPELYKECMKEGNILLNTNIRVDVNGKTFTEIKLPNKRSIIKPTERNERHMEPKVEKPEQMKTNDNINLTKNLEQTGDKKTTVVRGGQTVGILETAKKLLLEGKSYNDVLQSLIAIYMGVGRDAKRAKHNAQSTVFNAMKRLGLKKPTEE